MFGSFYEFHVFSFSIEYQLQSSEHSTKPETENTSRDPCYDKSHLVIFSVCY